MEENVSLNKVKCFFCQIVSVHLWRLKPTGVYCQFLSDTANRIVNVVFGMPSSLFEANFYGFIVRYFYTHLNLVVFFCFVQYMCISKMEN